MKKLFTVSMVLILSSVCISTHAQSTEVYPQETPIPESKLKSLNMIVPISPRDEDYEKCPNGQEFNLELANLNVCYSGKFTVEEVISDNKSVRSHVLFVKINQDSLYFKPEEIIPKDLMVKAVRDPRYEVTDFTTGGFVDLYYKTYHLTSKSKPKEELKILVLYVKPRKVSVL